MSENELKMTNLAEKWLFFADTILAVFGEFEKVFDNIYFQVKIGENWSKTGLKSVKN